MSETINHPKHYIHGGIEVIDVIEEFGLDFHVGNALKYIASADHKGDRTENLQKAVWYLKRRIGFDASRRLAPLKGKAAKIIFIQQAWQLPPWLDLAVYSLLVAATMVEDAAFVNSLRSALAYVEKELAGAP
jgi:hypothetical protein